MNVEIEYKVLVNKEDFNKLDKIFEHTNGKMYIQENTYFETPSFLLKSNHLSLRIRHIENRKCYVATLKEKIKDGHNEYEYEVNDNNKNSFPKEILDVLSKYNINIEEVSEIAKLKTIRKEYQYENGLLCLDHNFYYGKEDFEIEFECNDLEYGKQIVNKLLNELNIVFEKSKKSKIYRAIDNRN